MLDRRYPLIPKPIKAKSFDAADELKEFARELLANETLGNKPKDVIGNRSFAFL